MNKTQIEDKLRARVAKHHKLKLVEIDGHVLKATELGYEARIVYNTETQTCYGVTLLGFGEPLENFFHGFKMLCEQCDENIRTNYVFQSSAQ